MLMSKDLHDSSRSGQIGIDLIRRADGCSPDVSCRPFDQACKDPACAQFQSTVDPKITHGDQTLTPSHLGRNLFNQSPAQDLRIAFRRSAYIGNDREEMVA